jgi:hypothetical protein
MGIPRILLFIGIAFSIFNCSSETKPTISSVDETVGSIQLRVSLSGSTSFKAIVRSGTVTVSASDMTTMVSALSLSDSSATAEVVGVPTGKARLVEIKAFDSLGVVRYQGSSLVDVAADSTSNAAISLIRLTGTIVVDGKVVEVDSTPSTGTTAWPSPTTVSLGAQGSATLGATLDIDTKSAWTSAMANANQEKIDLVFLYYSAAFHLHDAVTAHAAGIANSINLTNSYDISRIKSVDMVKLMGMPASQEAAKSAFASGSVIHGTVVLVGDHFMVKTTDGKLTMVRVTAITGSSNTGHAALELYPLSIP